MVLFTSTFLTKNKFRSSFASFDFFRVGAGRREALHRHFLSGHRTEAVLQKASSPVHRPQRRRHPPRRPRGGGVLWTGPDVSPTTGRGPLHEPEGPGGPGPPARQAVRERPLPRHRVLGLAGCSQRRLWSGRKRGSASNCGLNGSTSLGMQPCILGSVRFYFFFYCVFVKFQFSCYWNKRIQVVLNYISVTVSLDRNYSKRFFVDHRNNLLLCFITFILISIIKQL